MNACAPGARGGNSGGPVAPLQEPRTPRTQLDAAHAGRIRGNTPPHERQHGHLAPAGHRGRAARARRPSPSRSSGTASRSSTTTASFRAISDICNHRGGPLSEGRLHGEFVMCPWHAWEYSVITGQGTGRLRRGAGARCTASRRATTASTSSCRRPCRASSSSTSRRICSSRIPSRAGAPPRVLGISTTGMDAVNPRFSTSDCLLEHALAHPARRARTPA